MVPLNIYDGDISYSYHDWTKSHTVVPVFRRAWYPQVADLSQSLQVTDTCFFTLRSGLYLVLRDLNEMEALTAWDYLVIIVMLAISGLIGIIFAIRSVGRQQSSSNYFLGDRHMSVFPVAMSLTATYISAITYLGTPSEVYLHGPKYGLMAMTRIFVPFLIVYYFVPVFYNLDITTVYEYLGMRFNNTVRFLVVAMEFFAGFTYMGTVVYAPALALSTVTGLNLTFSILATGIICTFYTTIGGIKAVIWTDVFQVRFHLTIPCLVPHQEDGGCLGLFEHHPVGRQQGKGVVG